MARLLWVLLLLGCAASEAPRATAATDADQLFRPANSTFRGADAAYSVPLGEGRTLWLFGDTFVGSARGSRSGSTMVRNTVGVQFGSDLTTGTLTLFHGPQNQEGKPTAWRGVPGERWLWPGPGVNLGDVLLLTFHELAPTSEGLGFRSVGSHAFLVRDFEGTPDTWVLQALEVPALPEKTWMGLGAMWLEGETLYAWVPREPEHDLFLVKWRRERAASGELARASWRTASGWSEDVGEAVPVVREVQTELSVHRNEASGMYWMISVDGFGGTNVVLRTAPAPEGPWSSARVLWRPPESEREDVLVYSAKAHPHLGQAPLWVTYCTNHLDFWTLAGDMSLYFPRFVAVTP